MAEAAVPKLFTNEDKWRDWAPTFKNYLRQFLGKDGVPLVYVTRRDQTPAPIVNLPVGHSFFDDYMALTPMLGEAFNLDAASVKTLIQRFVVSNTVAESKIQSLPVNATERDCWLTLKDHYEGVGLYSQDVTRAEQIIANLHYLGGKKSHMWWDKFERQLE